MNASTSSEHQNGKSDTSRGVARAVIKEALGVVFVALILFLPAGSLDWVMGWALVGVYAAWVAAMALILAPRCPELLIERTTRRGDFKTWDTVLMGIVGLTTIAKYILAGLDVRFGWTAQMLSGAGISPGLEIIALVITALGYALVTWAMAVNAFFSKMVRIQEDRGHTVATGGPYQVVRHPGYVGYIISVFATSLALGSLWVLIPAGLVMCLLIVRTALEDRTLQDELDGYKDYAQRVRCRLLPGVW